MKNIILKSILLGSLLSSYALANTIEEDIALKFVKDEDISDIMRNIETNKINPFFTITYTDFKPNTEYTPAKSSLFTTLFNARLTKKKGSEIENIEYLKTFIKLGIDLSTPQPDYVASLIIRPLAINKHIDVSIMASETCNLEVVNILKSAGVDFSYPLNSYPALERSYNTDPGSTEEKNCNDVLRSTLLDAKSWDLKSVFFFFNSEMGLRSNKFNYGIMLDPIPDDIKNTLDSKYGIKFSNKPTTDGPNDEQFKEFSNLITFETHRHDNPTHYDYWKKWWPQASKDKKDWLCFISSFDEAVLALKSAGWTDDDLATKNIPFERWSNFNLKSPPLGEFAVKIFTPYCNSLK